MLQVQFELSSAEILTPYHTLSFAWRLFRDCSGTTQGLKLLELKLRVSDFTIGLGKG